MEFEELRMMKRNLYDTIYSLGMNGNMQAAKLWLDEHKNVDVNNSLAGGVILLPAIEEE